MKTELEKAAEQFEYTDGIYGFKQDAKWQAETIGLMEIELNHTKTLLASCEKALENRDNQAERMYSEDDMKQFAFECVANFLSNNCNKVEMELVNVIMDRLNSQFEQFKKK
jgi:hypothetical protein